MTTHARAFIVISGDYEDREPVAVFPTKEDAQRLIDALNKHHEQCPNPRYFRLWEQIAMTDEMRAWKAAGPLGPDFPCNDVFSIWETRAFPAWPPSQEGT